ncbi:hypothetical protein D3C81_686940 [compost metagenome]
MQLAAAHAYAGAEGGAEDADAPGLHGTEQASIDTAGRRRQVLDDLTVGHVDAVASDHQAQLVPGFERAAAFDARGDQLEGSGAVALASVEYLQRAIGGAGIEVFDALVFKFGRADQKACAGGVDEAATVEGDAIGVGQDVIGRSAEDFLGAFDARGVAADHFTEDGRGGLALELRVGGQGAGQLRLPGLQGVVQHQPGLVDVVVEELVVRQAAGIRGDDVDHRHAVLIGDQWRTGNAGCRLQAVIGQADAWGHQAQGDHPAQAIEPAPLYCGGGRLGHHGLLFLVVDIRCSLPTPAASNRSPGPGGECCWRAGRVGSQA